MTTFQLFKLLQLILGSLIIGTVLIVIRLRTRKPWAAILRGRDTLSRYIYVATIGLILLLFAIFFVINNGYFK